MARDPHENRSAITLVRSRRRKRCTLPAAPPCLSFASPTVCRSVVWCGLKTRQDDDSGESGAEKRKEVRKCKAHWAGEGFIGPDILTYMVPSSSLSRPTVRPCVGVGCWLHLSPESTFHRPPGRNRLPLARLGSARPATALPPPATATLRARRDPRTHLDPDPANCARRRYPFLLDATAVERGSSA